MKHTPWSQEDAENEVFNRIVYGKRLSPHQQEIWLDALAWAAEIIEAAPTVYATTMADLAWHRQHFEGYGMQAKLVGVQRIEGEK